MTTCVLVADASRARIFSAATSKDDLVEIVDLFHPESKLHPRELATDGPGVTFDRNGQGLHSMGQQVDVKKQEAIRFAKEVSERLIAVLQKNRFHKLYIVAAPAFLGLLRNSFSTTVSKMITGEIDKNLTAFDPEHIRTYLPERL